jgi:hypothetical protein
MVARLEQRTPVAPHCGRSPRSKMAGAFESSTTRAHASDTGERATDAHQPERESDHHTVTRLDCARRAHAHDSAGHARARAPRHSDWHRSISIGIWATVSPPGSTNRNPPTAMTYQQKDGGSGHEPNTHNEAGSKDRAPGTEVQGRGGSAPRTSQRRLARVGKPDRAGRPGPRSGTERVPMRVLGELGANLGANGSGRAWTGETAVDLEAFRSMLCGRLWTPVDACGHPLEIYGSEGCSWTA